MRFCVTVKVFSGGEKLDKNIRWSYKKKKKSKGEGRVLQRENPPAGSLTRYERYVSGGNIAE